jgi:hypothetical protein
VVFKIELVSHLEHNESLHLRQFVIELQSKQVIDPPDEKSP